MRRVGPISCLLLVAGLALGGSALGASDTISTVAGDGSGAFGGDNGPATQASLKNPEGVAATSDGGFLIADKDNHRIRRVAPDGTITTVAGTGSAGFNGDARPATTAALNKPEGVAALNDGGFLIADTGNCRIRRVSPLGTVSTVAGTGGCNYSGDGGLAILAQVKDPRAAVPTPDGGFLIADTANHVIRRVTPLGTISTVAGTGAGGYDGDGGPATEARLDAPDDVAQTADGGLLIADYAKDVIRRVSPVGTISTVAFQGSGGSDDEDNDEENPATLDEPADVELLPDGGFLIAAHAGHRVLRVRPDGVIVSFAGTPSASGFAGDGGPASAARLDGPHGLSVTPEGNVLIADGHNHRIRHVDADFAPATPGSEPGRGEDDESEGSPLGPASEPKRGRSVLVAPGFGLVKVRLPGRKGWVLLEDDATIPVGSMINTRNGSVVLTSALDSEGRSQTGSFWEGVFQIRQPANGNGMTDIVLRGGRFGRCRSRGKRPRALSSRRRRPVRRLWAKDDNGRFRTHGRDSVATTRGTVWFTADRCRGTLTRVKEGKVRVRHLRGRRSVLVSAGQRYLARHR